MFDNNYFTLMKKYLTLINFLFLCSFLYGQNAPYAPEKMTWKWFRAKDKTCEIKIPASWSVEENFGDYRFFVRSYYDSEKDRFMENISVFIQENAIGTPDERLKNYIEDVKTELPKILGKIELSEPKFFTAKGMQLCELVCKHNQGGLALKWKQISYVKGSKIVTITFTAEEIAYKNYEAVANVIMLSFNML